MMSSQRLSCIQVRRFKPPRKKQHLSQAVFAKYLNESPIIRSLEHGTRHAQGAILKLLNIVNKHGIDALI